MIRIAAAPIPAIAAILLACLLASPRTAAAQTATAVPTLDLNRLMGTWYEIARLPIKRERHCIGDEMVLYALGDKRNSFQVVTSCRIKDDNTGSWNGKGKMDKAGDGRLKLSRLLIFSTKYWVLATGPSFDWALVGGPNHKTVWILSRAITLPPATLADIRSRAAAEGFNTSRLIAIPQHASRWDTAAAAPAAQTPAPASAP